ncbi:MAG: VWA domain-containing protein [Planctomycetota bacterium]|nr:VWA domain-containing protein [Planctomycetota bacterium]
MVTLVLIVMVALLATAAFSVDIAYMQLTRAQLRASTDAAARAATEAISRTGDVKEARRVAKQVAATNHVASQPLIIKDEDIVFGNSAKAADGTWKFSANVEPFNSARVLGDRTKESAGGSVGLAFGSMLGRNDFEPSLNATAAKVGSAKRDFVIVADRSHSMAFDLSGRDWVYPRGSGSWYCQKPHPVHSRWAHLVLAVGEFVDGLGDTEDEERLGLVTYASSYYGCDGYYPDAGIDVSVSTVPEDVSGFLAKRSKQAIPGGTNIHAGITQGIQAISDTSRVRKDATKVLVVMTDGRHNTGPEPIYAAQEAKRRGIIIITITFSGGADQVRMKAVATLTGGQHFHAPTANDLKKIFRQVADGTIGLVFVE